MKPTSWADAERPTTLPPRRAREAKPLTVYVLGQHLVPEPLVLEALANRPEVGKLIYVPIGNAHPAHSKNYTRYSQDYNKWVADYNHQLNATSHATEKPKHYADVPAHNHWKMRGYDIKPLLMRHGGPGFSPQQISTRVQECIEQSGGMPVPTRGADVVLNLSLGFLGDYYARRDRKAYFPNHGSNAQQVNYKTNLRDIVAAAGKGEDLQIGAEMRNVHTGKDIQRFMKMNGLDQCVIKIDRTSGGRGVFRVFYDELDRLMVEVPEIAAYADLEKQPARIEKLDIYARDLRQFKNTALDHVPDKALAMEWLEPSKGDVRLVVFNGRVMGGYIRHAKEGSWLCNCSQGGSYESFDWTREFSTSDQRKVDLVVDYLERCGVTRCSLDFLANAKGEWFLSEINAGISRDVNGVHEHGAADRAQRGEISVADEIAQDLLDQHRQHMNPLRLMMR